jgi:Domain of unknown function (DUF4340)
MRSGTLIHVGVLAASVVVAAVVWTRDKEPKALAAGDTPVWSGRSGDVQKVTYESKTRKVAVEAKSDATGRYFVGTVEKDTAAPPAGKDGGPPPTPPPATAAKTTVGFVSVTAGEKLADALGPLKALRALGKIGDDRAAEFGLADPEATVVVTLSGAEHKLSVGSATPGGGDRYVKDPASGEVYVLKGDAIRNLESADSLLLEHELHEWKEADVQKAHVEAGGKGRDLVRGGAEAKRFWADAATPDGNDETLGNWMSKLDRLRPTDFAQTGPEGKELVLRVEYTGKKPLGWVEIVKVPGATDRLGSASAGADKPAYYLRTERTRLFGKVPTPLAEQVEQDLGTIVK